MQRFTVKLFCKTIEWLLRLRTWMIRFPEKDPTQILIDNYTEAQHQAAQRLQYSETQTKYDLASKPNHVLIAIPFRDQTHTTQQCLTSIFKQELINTTITIGLVNNGSTGHTTLEWLNQVTQYATGTISIVILNIDQAFNFSNLINSAVKQYANENTDWILMLNNDTEMRTSTDLQRLIDFANGCPNLGVLGCTLLYPDNKIQHLFSAPGQKIVAGHPLKGIMYNEHHTWYQQARPVAAVTGACQLVSYDNFVKAGMLDEKLPTLGQDIDLCLKLQNLNLTNWVLPEVVLYHHEGLSKGHSFNKTEIQRMYDVWGDMLYDNEYYSKKFTRWSEYPVYGLMERRYPWVWLVL